MTVIEREHEDLYSPYGVFISHSSKDSSFNKVAFLLRERGISFISDEELTPGEKYIDRINRLLNNANGGIVLLSKEALQSSWVLYEIGMIEGMGKEIIIFYDGIEDVKNELPILLKKYRIINDLEQLCEVVSKFSIYANIFKHETQNIKRIDFKNSIVGKIKNLKLSFFIKNLNDLKDSIQFGYIIIRLARYGEVKKAYTDCLTTNETRDGKLCRYSENDCAFFDDVTCEEAKETIILNSVLYYSIFDNNNLRYIIPCHKKYGVTFKCFVDVEDISDKKVMVRILKESGIKEENISYSKSAENQRINFLLDESPNNGLFHMVTPGGNVNNFFCPGALYD